MKSSFLKKGLFASSILVVLLNILFYLKPLLDSNSYQNTDLYTTLILSLLLMFFYLTFRQYQLKQFRQALIISGMIALITGIGIGITSFIHTAYIEDTFLIKSMKQVEIYWAENNYSAAAITGQAEHYMFNNPLNYAIVNTIFIAILSFIIAMFTSMIYMLVTFQYKKEPYEVAPS